VVSEETLIVVLYWCMLTIVRTAHHVLPIHVHGTGIIPDTVLNQDFQHD
jgi:hypothetical protein